MEKKPPHEWTDEEALKRLFPKKVTDHATDVAHEGEESEEEDETEPEPEEPE